MEKNREATGTYTETSPHQIGRVGTPAPHPTLLSNHYSFFPPKTIQEHIKVVLQSGAPGPLALHNVGRGDPDGTIQEGSSRKSWLEEGGWDRSLGHT